MATRAAFPPAVKPHASVGVVRRRCEASSIAIRRSCHHFPVSASTRRLRTAGDRRNRAASSTAGDDSRGGEIKTARLTQCATQLAAEQGGGQCAGQHADHGAETIVARWNVGRPGHHVDHDEGRHRHQANRNDEQAAAGGFRNFTRFSRGPAKRRMASRLNRRPMKYVSNAAPSIPNIA